MRIKMRTWENSRESGVRNYKLKGKKCIKEHDGNEVQHASDDGDEFEQNRLNQKQAFQKHRIKQSGYPLDSTGRRRRRRRDEGEEAEQ